SETHRCETSAHRVALRENSAERSPCEGNFAANGRDPSSPGLADLSATWKRPRSYAGSRIDGSVPTLKSAAHRATCLPRVNRRTLLRGVQLIVAMTRPISFATEFIRRGRTSSQGSRRSSPGGSALRQSSPCRKDFVRATETALRPRARAHRASDKGERAS